MTYCDDFLYRLIVEPNTNLVYFEGLHMKYHCIFDDVYYIPGNKLLMPHISYLNFCYYWFVVGCGTKPVHWVLYSYYVLVLVC